MVIVKSLDLGLEPCKKPRGSTPRGFSRSMLRPKPEAYAACFIMLRSTYWRMPPFL